MPNKTTNFNSTNKIMAFLMSFGKKQFIQKKQKQKKEKSRKSHRGKRERIKTRAKTVKKRTGDDKEGWKKKRMNGIRRNKTMPEIRCKIEAIAIGERLTLITWLKGRLIGRLLFTAGILFAVIFQYLLLSIIEFRPTKQ